MINANLKGTNERNFNAFFYTSNTYFIVYVKRHCNDKLKCKKTFQEMDANEKKNLKLDTHQSHQQTLQANHM